MSDEIKSEPTITESLESITRSIENFIGLQSAPQKTTTKALGLDICNTCHTIVDDDGRCWCDIQ